MKLNGKYIIQKNNQKIQQNNNLTIFGAIQIARLLKRNIVFPKFKNKPFGYTRAYGGQYEKVSIINGSDLQYSSDNFSDFDSNYSSLNITNQYSDLYTIDDDYSTYTKMNFNSGGNSYRTSYFDINLPQPLNIAKIGLVAKTDGYETTDQYYKHQKYSDWSIYFRPQGVNIQFETDSSNYNTNLLNTAGDYIRVYNVNYPTHNGKPYFVMNKIITYQQLVENQPIEKTKRVFYCLYYNTVKNGWAVRDVTDFLNSPLTAQDQVGYTTLDKYIFSKSNRSNLDQDFIYIIPVSSVTQKSQYLIQPVEVDQQSFGKAPPIKLNRKKINKWIKPNYRLHNYLTNFYGQNTTTQTQQFRNMQLVSDFGDKITNKNGNTQQSTQNIKYAQGDVGFNQYLAYSCFSFQSINTTNELYNFKEGVYQCSVDFCNQNLVGFIPYVDGIRFKKQNNDGTNRPNDSRPRYCDESIMFYSVDVFVKNPTPYNPIKIGLSQNGVFSDVNSWFVDKIEKVGNNKVVFTKELDVSQGMTFGDGYKYIGLFGNFDGHLDATLPADIRIKDSNCFSKAQFATAWQKDAQESVVITYQLTIGDE